MQCVAFDFREHYTWALVQDEAGKVRREQWIDRVRGALRGFLRGLESGTPVAVETIGNWYWITDEIKAAGMVPQLANARKAKLRRHDFITSGQDSLSLDLELVRAAEDTPAVAGSSGSMPWCLR